MTPPDADPGQSFAPLPPMKHDFGTRLFLDRHFLPSLSHYSKAGGLML